MGNSREAWSGMSSGSIISRELALAADRALWADEQSHCITIIASIYELYDDLEQGLEPDRCSRVVAASTAAWVGDIGRRQQLLNGMFVNPPPLSGTKHTADQQRRP